MEKYLSNPIVGKLVATNVGLTIVWVTIKLIQRNFLAKIANNDNRYRPINSATS